MPTAEHITVLCIYIFVPTAGHIIAPCWYLVVATAKHNVVPCWYLVVATAIHNVVPCWYIVVPTAKHNVVPCWYLVVATAKHNFVPCWYLLVSTAEHNIVPCWNLVVPTAEEVFVSCWYLVMPTAEDGIVSCWYLVPTPENNNATFWHTFTYKHLCVLCSKSKSKPYSQPVCNYNLHINFAEHRATFFISLILIDYTRGFYLLIFSNRSLFIKRSHFKSVTASWSCSFIESQFTQLMNIILGVCGWNFTVKF